MEVPSELNGLSVPILRDLLSEFPDPDWGKRWELVSPPQKKSKIFVSDENGDDILNYKISLDDKILVLNKPLRNAMGLSSLKNQQYMYKLKKVAFASLSLRKEKDL